MSEIEKQVAANAAQGDEAAFASIFEAHRHEVYRIARAVTGDRETALDAVQETFFKVHEGLKRFRGESSLRTWVVRIAVRAAIDQRRRARRHPAGVPFVNEPSHDPRVRMEDALALRSVQELARRLPRQQRLVFLLTLLGGLTNAEIAGALGLREPNIRMHMSNAVRRLREWL
jgi:RNA polymerase sigma-70 factor, ECF subfamily